MFNVMTKVFALAALMMLPLNSYAAAVEITGDSQPTYTNNGTLTGTLTIITDPFFGIIDPIVGIYNIGSSNIITNATSGTINSSASNNERSFGIFSGDPYNFILSNNNTLTNSGTINVTGDYALVVGIESIGDGNIITNTGNITAIEGESGSGSAFGIYSFGTTTGDKIANSGTITAIVGDNGGLLMASCPITIALS